MRSSRSATPVSARAAKSATGASRQRPHGDHGQPRPARHRTFCDRALLLDGGRIVHKRARRATSPTPTWRCSRHRGANMCGFLVYSAHGDNSRIRGRGPDATHRLKMGGLTFVHNLLATTGAFMPQPFIERDVVCVYNGEIYNQPFTRQRRRSASFRSTEEHGVNFARQLDGEFAIALYDFRPESIAVFATDPFKSEAAVHQRRRNAPATGQASVATEAAPNDNPRRRRFRTASVLERS